MKKVYYVRAKATDRTADHAGWEIEKKVIRTSPQRAINAFRKEIEVDYLHEQEAATTANGWDYEIVQTQTLEEAYEEALNCLTLETASISGLTLKDPKHHRLARIMVLRGLLDWMWELSK